MTPVDEIRELYKIDRKFAESAISILEKNAEFRLSEQERTNTFVYRQRLYFMLQSSVITILGLVTVGFCAYYGYSDTASILGVAVMSSLVTMTVVKRKSP